MIKKTYFKIMGKLEVRQNYVAKIGKGSSNAL